jgi:hypothetical protein
LYEPKFLERRTVDLPEDQAANPVVYGGVIGGVAGGVASASPAPPPSRMAKARAPMNGRDLKQMVTTGNSPAMDQEQNSLGALSSVTANVASADLGELFEYHFSTSVTVKKDESAMLPFLQQKIGSRKLLIYSENYGEHPMNAAELTNSTGKTLDGGPITVFDAQSYAGEALMTTLKTGDKRLISYAVDLGTRITTKFDSNGSLVREIHVNRGMLTTRLAQQETRTFAIQNVDQKPKTLVIEHPERPGFKLLNQKPSETTSNAYRFEVKLTPGAAQKFAINEEQLFDNTFEVSSLTPDAILTYVQNKAISDTGRRQLQQILDLKRQIADAESQIHQTDSEITTLVNDQERVRRNIQSLNSVSGQQEQVQKYARQLATQENQLATMRDHSSELKKQKSTLESSLNTQIEKLDF